MILEGDALASVVRSALGEARFEEVRSGRLSDLQIDLLAEDGDVRSRFCFEVLRSSRADERLDDAPRLPAPAEQHIYFYWDTDPPPLDVLNNLQSWRALPVGLDQRLFSDADAQAFIAERLAPENLAIYRWCPHPAMKSDYFRLCYGLLEGGVYIDADDGYLGRGLEGQLSPAAHLALHPLVWDFSAQRNVPVGEWDIAGGMRPGCGYYFNNTPLISRPGSDVVRKALERAGQRVEALAARGGVPDIHAMTGPEAVTVGLFWHALMTAAGRSSPQSFRPLPRWSEIAAPQPLKYKGDDRNWRHYAEAVPGGLLQAGQVPDQAVIGP